jgi:hypothetical protein
MNACRFTSLVVVSLCALVGVLACGVGSAGAFVSQFGSYGEGAGEFKDGHGIAVDQASGDVLVLDRENDRVDRFTGEGVFVMAWGEGVADGITHTLQTCTTTCFRGIRSGSGVGQLGNSLGGVAVDNDPLSVSYKDVYVSEGANKRVEKFTPTGSFISMFGKEVNENGTSVCVAGEKCRAGKEGTGDGEFNDIQEGAIAVDPTGNVFVGDHERVQKFGPEGAFLASFSTGTGYTRSIAVDGTDDLYVVNELPPSLVEYDASGTLVRTLDTEGHPEEVTLDESGDLFVEDNLENGHHRMLEYSPGGEELSSFDAGKPISASGLALGETVGALYLIEEPSHVRLLALPVPGPELVGDGSVSGVEPTSATLNATVNPENNPTTYRFEYGMTNSYGSSAPTPEGSLPASFNEEPVAVTLTKLTAGTTYHYRVVATDSKGHVATGIDRTFTTQPAVSIDSVSVTNVAATSATFEALLNPLGADATYRLEYDTSEYALGGPPHGASASEGSLGAGSSDVPISAHVDGLQPGTVYHYRVVAEDVREGIAYTVDGPDETLRTQTVGGGPALPDGRRWEMVSPAAKQGAQILAIGQYSGEGAVIESAAGGYAMTYATVAPTEAEPQGYTNYVQVLAVRSSGGWSSRVIAIPHDTATGIAVGTGEEYRFFSEDLSFGVLQPFGAFVPSLSSEASEQTAYVRTDFIGGDVNNPCSSSCYRPLVTGMPGHANVPPGTAFGEEGTCPGSKGIYCGPEFIDATPDAKHVVLRSPHATLTSTPTGGVSSLYEWSDGALALISVLPDGKIASESGFESGGTRRAISDDGSRVVWSGPGGHLYLRDIAKGVTVQLDTVQGGSGEGNVGAEFQIASSDASRVFFTSTQDLTGNLRGLGSFGLSDLYECEMVEEAGELKCKLSDLTPSSSGGPGVQGVVGASDDGSWVYFVAGTTLYVHHGGTTKPVAVLSGADENDWYFKNLTRMTARVSSDGRWLAFMSQRELTGYDTHDAGTGEPDEEVYLYDATANGGAGRMVCASCDPTGARPVGILDPEDKLTLGDRVWGSQRIAANIPGWTPYSGGGTLYQSRYLSDGGRLLFNSNDGLVPQDVNGTEDVYEYEPPGVGDCTSSSTSFSERSGGCVGLVSSGGSGEESGFLDASATGGDVFFLTSARLSSADRDTAVDIYDAHECTTGSPCFATPPVQPPVCDTGDSCKAAPSPQPAVFGAPSSATFSGAGNVGSSGTKLVVRSKGLTRAQKLARALNECRRKRGRQRRASCTRHARARYATKLSSRATSTKKGRR